MSEQPEQPTDDRQYVKFTFYGVDPGWRRLPQGQRAEGREQLLNLLQGSGEAMITSTYSTLGTRRDTEFFVWQIADDLWPIQEFASRLVNSEIGPYLTVTESFLSLTRRSMYRNPKHPGASAARERVTPLGRQFLFVYPFVKTRAWYLLPKEERQRMMNEHIEIGHKYHSVKINTTYSYGIDDQEFVLAFEADDPKVFLDLVMELRETRASSYTERDTPMYTCRLMEPAELLTHVGL
ncbi:MAG: chlorite dismutase [Dehalococcoidia bacterium]|nr:chlorite dismutase [Dehalococcoidia bacterium]